MTALCSSVSNPISLTVGIFLMVCWFLHSLTFQYLPAEFVSANYSFFSFTQLLIFFLFCDVASIEAVKPTHCIFSVFPSMVQIIFAMKSIIWRPNLVQQPTSPNSCMCSYLHNQIKFPISFFLLSSLTTHSLKPLAGLLLCS
jgi:hypothetical protein